MEKVVLTKEQVEAIEWYREEKVSNSTILDNHFFDGEQSDFKKRLHENQIATDTLVAALYIGYEIDNSYKKGDKVLFQVGDSIPYVATLQNRVFQNKDEWSTDEAIGHISGQYFRHATAEEIYWIGELGREKVGEFREGDIYIKQNEACYLVGSDVFADRASDWYEDDGDFKGIYPAESFRPYPQEEFK